MASLSGSESCKLRHLQRSFDTANRIPPTTSLNASDLSCDSCDASGMTSCASSGQSSTTMTPCVSCDNSTTNPKHPKYQDYTARVGSYVGWPGKYVPKTPEELSTAGFFYIGSADRVTCFQCGVTFRDWEAGHDPIREHSKYSKHCHFIKHIVQDCKCTATVKALSSNQDEINGSSNDPNSTQQLQSSNSLPGLAAGSEEPRKVKSNSYSVNSCDTQMDKLTISSLTSKRMASLLEENRRLKEEGVCRLCKTEPSTILFLPCGHLVACSDCAETVVDCISCGKQILGTVRTYRA